jgi:RHS repeat-associated protein
MISEITDGVILDYVPDALGSIHSVIDQDANVVKTMRYKPYGEVLSRSGTVADRHYQWVGTYGYRATFAPSSSHYVRARHYSATAGSWSTVDPLWPSQRAFVYVNGGPTVWIDPSGLDQGYPYYPPKQGTVPKTHPGPPPTTGPGPHPAPNLEPPHEENPFKCLGGAVGWVIRNGTPVSCVALLLAPCQTGDDNPEHYHRPSHRDCLEWYKKYNDFKPNALPSCKSKPVNCAKLEKELKEFNDNMLQYRFLILRCDKWPPKAPPGEEPWRPKPGHAKQLCEQVQRARNCQLQCPGIKKPNYEWILRNCDRNGGNYIIY